MEFFGILHCVQDDSNYKTAATATARRLTQQLQGGCNSNSNSRSFGMTNRTATAGFAEGSSQTVVI